MRSHCSGIALALPVALALTSPAPAGESPGLALDGFLELELLHGEVDGTALAGDLRLFTTRPEGLGFEVGLTGHSGSGSDELALYATLSVGFAGGRISAGVPRPAYGSFSAFPAVGGIEALRRAQRPINGDLAELAYLAGDTDPPLGLRYDGRFGRLALAASAHRFGDIGADDRALAARFDLTTNIALLADWERFAPDGAAHTTTSRAGAELHHGAISSGLAYFNRDFGAAPHVDGTESWIRYRATPEISVTASGLQTNVHDMIGLSLRYEHPAGARAKLYGEIGIADERTVGATFDLSVGLRF